jgi:hypothetical protein
MKRTSPIAIVVLVVLAVLPARAIAADSPSLTATTRVAALMPHLPTGATRVGPLPATQQLTIDVVLHPSHRAELDSLLGALYDPTSPQYEHWLTPGEFAREFGPSPAQVAGVTAWLNAKGLHTAVKGFAVQTTAAAPAVATALGVSFSRYRLARGELGYAAASAPLIPRGLVAGITSIIGLSDTVRFRNHVDLTPRRRSRSGVSTGHAAPKACASAAGFAGTSFWTPDQVSALYKVDHLVSAGLDGHGKKIAVVELGQSRPVDASNYLACFGLHNNVSVRKLDGGAAPDMLGTLEADLDIQEAATNAPGSPIVSYEAPNNGTGNFDVYNQIVLDNVPIVSTSWGSCEDALQTGAPGFIDSLHTVFQQAAAQGQSVFAAAGDEGSEDCYDPTVMAPDDALGVDNPADDPFVTGAGGTSLEGAGIEPVWNDCEAVADNTCAAGGAQAAGGGQSTVFLQPSWQPSAADRTCSNCRGVPDVSANAGVGEVFYDSDAGGSNWIAVGGTSMAAPKLAGMAADIASSCAGRIGDFAPKLDALAATNVYGRALSDVTTGLDLSGPNLVQPGDNDLTRTNGGHFHTATGFDLASGIGSPIASGLSCPKITSLAPAHGKAGMHVTLHGLGLERATIRFGSTPATVLTATAESATVIVPPGTGRVSVSGSNPIGAGFGGATFAYPVAPGGYRIVAADGGIFSFGGARFYGAPVGSSASPIVGAAVDQTTGGYWLASADGTVHNFNAPALGSVPRGPTDSQIVGIAATKTGKGYWLVARAGGVFAFGDAHFLGSMGASHLNQPIVGIAATKNGDGYWLVASDGGVFAFGKARFFGSTGGIHLNQPIVGIAVDPVTGGYRMVASDGGVFAFGKARFFGSTGGIHLNRPIVGMTGDAATGGYWLVASDGGVFAFNARFFGSTGAIVLNQPIVAIAPSH